MGGDYPFPESGLVPCYFLYGVMGVDARPDGLKITPRLPEALTYAEVKGINWRSITLTVHVTRKTVEIDGITADGQPYKKKFNIKPGENVTLPVTK